MSETQTCRDISALTVEAQKACRAFLEKCEKAGVDIFLTETYRSQERQNALYAQGRTAPGQIVTWTKNSRHTSRRAWDIACNLPQALYDTSVLKQAGQIGMEMGITWGGSWQTPDMPHFEVDTDFCWVEETEEEEEMEPIYQTLEEVPQWGKATIQKLMDKGFLSGDGKALRLTETAVRVLVIQDRAGLYD